MSGTRTTVLFTVPVPPPYSGPEVLGELLLRTGLDDDFQIEHVSTSVNKSNRDRGALRFTVVVAGIKLWLALVRSLIRHRPRLLYLFLSQNRVGFIRDAAIIVTAQAFGTMVVGHVHGGNFERFFSLSSHLFQRFVRRILRACRLVMLSGRTFLPQFSGLVPAERLRVVWNPVDIRAFDAVVPRCEEVGGCRILFVGHLSIAKGFLDLMDAVPYVLDQQPGVSVDLMGEWILEERNIKQDQKGGVLANDATMLVERWRDLNNRYPGRLRHISRVSDREKIVVVKSADIFVLPSYSEGFPMSVLEAMAAGLPMVLTPVGALPEVLTEKNAVFVEPGDVGALRHALLKLANNPDLRATMGAANRQLVAERFTPEVISRSLAACFRECLV